MDNEIIDGGCILLSRQILKSDIWRKPPEYLKIFLYILLKVNHKNGLFPRGSNFFNFSDEKPSGVTKDQIYKFLAWSKRKDVNILATQKATRGVIIKVNNYDRYQTLENYKRQDKPQDNGRIAAGQRQDNGRTINNNVIMEECNKVIDIHKGNKNFIPPTLQEVTDYCTERKNNVDPNRFIDFYTSKGWFVGKNKMKDWRAAVRTWERKDKKNSNYSAAVQNSNKESFYMSLSR